MGIAEGRGPSLDLARQRIFTLPERFRREATDGFVADYALSVDGVGFEITVGGGRCSVRERNPASPSTRIETDAATWLALDDGRLSSAEAFLAGRVVVRGNVEHAVRLPTMFRPSGRERTPQDLEHETIRVGEHRLSAFVLGQGPAVVLLHGLAATKLSWLPLLAPLAERYRVVAVDLPGHGESSKTRADYTPEFFSKVVRRALASVGIGRAALIGNSMGGRVALEIAASAPGEVAALVLLGPALAGLPFPFLARFLQLLPAEVARVPLPMRRRLVTSAIRQLFAEPGRLPPAAYLAGADEFIRVYRSARARVALLSSMRGLVRDRPAAFWDRVRSTRAPTLIVWGEDDRLVPVRMGRRLAEELPGAELRILPGVGHVPQFEAPELTADLVRGFLDDVYGEPVVAAGRSTTRKQEPRGRFGS